MTDIEFYIVTIVYSLEVVYGIVHIYKLNKHIADEMKKYREEAGK